jgi:hypothetical protein
VAFGAFGFLFAVDERLELVMALLADVFKNGHFTPPKKFPLSIRINLWGLRKFYSRQGNIPTTRGGIPGK